MYISSCMMHHNQSPFCVRVWSYLGYQFKQSLKNQWRGQYNGMLRKYTDTEQRETLRAITVNNIVFMQPSVTCTGNPILTGLLVHILFTCHEAHNIHWQQYCPSAACLLCILSCYSQPSPGFSFCTNFQLCICLCSTHLSSNSSLLYSQISPSSSPITPLILVISFGHFSCH